MTASKHSTESAHLRPTINDVARHARVSVATVSRVINAPDSVSLATRDRVRSTMEALAYVPQNGVRGRPSGRTGNIGVLLQASPGITQGDSIFLQILSGVESAAEDANFAVVVSVRQSIVEEAEHGIRGLMPGRVDGLVVTGTQVAARHLEGIRRTGLPVVLLGPEEAVEGLWCVAVDARGGSELAVTHLLQAGRRRIAHIGGPRDSIGALKKREGYRLAHEHVGLAVDPQVWDADTEIHSPSRGWRSVERMLEAGIEIDGLFADDDLLAMGALGALAAHGRRVPDDVSVVGFGGLAETRSTRPALTTMDVDFYQQGWLAATILTRLLKGGDRTPPAARVLLETRLTIRESSLSTVADDADDRRGE